MDRDEDAQRDAQRVDVPAGEDVQDAVAPEDVEPINVPADAQPVNAPEILNRVNVPPSIMVVILTALFSERTSAALQRAAAYVRTGYGNCYLRSENRFCEVVYHYRMLWLFPSLLYLGMVAIFWARAGGGMDARGGRGSSW